MNFETEKPTPASIVSEALSRGQNALSEFDAKRLLAAYGVPVTREDLATSADQAVAIARQMGTAVALKACGANLLHKTEAGLVRLNLATADQVAAAYDELVAAAGAGLEGILVQQMVAGQREVVAGMVRDGQFGPCVMLGVGGVFTEAIDDAVMRMAPVTAKDVDQMIADLRAKAILGPWRGQAPADVAALTNVLIGLGRIGLEHEQVAEIDVNPLIIAADGSIVAVDALVVLRKGN